MSELKIKMDVLALGMGLDRHSRLMEKAGRLPYGDAGVYRRSLTELYGKFEEQLQELSETVKAYQEVAELVAKQKPLFNERKYVYVRKAKEVVA